MGAMAFQITSFTIVYSTVYSGADQRKHQSPASLAFVLRIHRRSVNSPHKWLVTRKMFPFDDAIMTFNVFRKTSSDDKTKQQVVKVLWYIGLIQRTTRWLSLLLVTNTWGQNAQDLSQIWVREYLNKLSKIKSGLAKDRSIIIIIMSAMASQITSLSIVNSTVYSDQRKHQSSESLAFVRGIHRRPVNSPHKGPVTRIFQFDDVIM